MTKTPTKAWMGKDSEPSSVHSMAIPSLSLVSEDTPNESASVSSIRYGSFHGSVSESTRRRSERMSQVSMGSRDSEGCTAFDDHVDSDTESHSGRKFVNMQKHPDKTPSKQRRMNSIVDLGGEPVDGTESSGFHAFGALSDEGYNASYNQDAMLHINGVGNVPHTAIFGVFDGHGNHGDEVANFAKELVYKSFLENYNQSGTSLPTEEVVEIIISSFLSTQSVMEKAGDQFLLAGTTASVVFFQNRMAFFANVGDSRIVLGRECVCCNKMEALNPHNAEIKHQNARVMALPVSIDHRVGEIAEEKERVLRAGGLVQLDPELPPDTFDEMRIYAPEQRYPGLVTSRTLGDTLGHSLGVISNPEVSFKRIDEYDQVIIIGSDGVWDILSDQEAVDLVMRHKDPESATNALVDACVRGWSDEFDVGDNVSAIVLFLKDNSSACDSNVTEVKSIAVPSTSAPTTTQETTKCSHKWTWMEVRQQMDLKQCEAELNRMKEVATDASGKIPTTSISASTPSSPSKPKANQPVIHAEASAPPSNPDKSNSLASGSSAQKTESDKGYQAKALVPHKRTKMCIIL